ncbi:BQ5605_C040g11855 [Microbotryum silenes-dioicae]|uniref:BQ5605_C040g11855 protein n=1 Tax=Microbotryum silenes-dioicae TaxID=796604 RepID=A0A2X0MU45_9BASI|nr:BQ5605_C040g11855 [Microbotryum silenes-dioicae]
MYQHTVVSAAPACGHVPLRSHVQALWRIYVFFVPVERSYSVPIIFLHFFVDVKQCLHLYCI